MASTAASLPLTMTETPSVSRPAGPLEGATMDQVHRQFQTNVFGLIALNKAFIPHFHAQGSGAIVNIGSISADQDYPPPNPPPT